MAVASLERLIRDGKQQPQLPQPQVDTIALQLDHLWTCAHQMVATSPHLAQFYLNQMRDITQRYDVTLLSSAETTASVQYRMCMRCCAFFLPGVNCSVRLKKVSQLSAKDRDEVSADLSREKEKNSTTWRAQNVVVYRCTACKHASTWLATKEGFRHELVKHQAAQKLREQKRETQRAREEPPKEKEREREPLKKSLQSPSSVSSSPAAPLSKSPLRSPAQPSPRNATPVTTPPPLAQAPAKKKRKSGGSLLSQLNLPAKRAAPATQSPLQLSSFLKSL